MSELTGERIGWVNGGPARGKSRSGCAEVKGKARQKGTEGHRRARKGTEGHGRAQKGTEGHRRAQKGTEGQPHLDLCRVEYPHAACVHDAARVLGVAKVSQHARCATGVRSGQAAEQQSVAVL